MRHIVCWFLGHKPCDCVKGGPFVGLATPKLHCKRCGMVKY